MTDDTPAASPAVQELADRLRRSQPAQLLALCGLLAGELGRAKSADGRPAPDRKELKRRCNYLASRAEVGPYGRLICGFCGKAVTALPNAFARHQLTAHGDEVAELPSYLFERFHA